MGTKSSQPSPTNASCCSRLITELSSVGPGTWMMGDLLGTAGIVVGMTNSTREGHDPEETETV